MTIDTKDLIEFFYEKQKNPGQYKCKNEKCLKIRSEVESKGYTNLKNHLRTCIGNNFEDVYLQALQSNSLKVHGFTAYNKRDVDIHKLLQYFVMTPTPFSMIDNGYFRQVHDLSDCSRTTLVSYIKGLQSYVREAIIKDIHPPFAEMFDGWTDCRIHYVAVFVTYVDKCGDYKEVLLAIRPVGVGDFTVKTMLQFLKFQVEQYNLNLHDVAALFGDNCSTNQAIANQLTEEVIHVAEDLNVPLLGCCSHKLNLAVNLWLDLHCHRVHVSTQFCGEKS